MKFNPKETPDAPWAFPSIGHIEPEDDVTAPPHPRGPLPSATPTVILEDPDEDEDDEVVFPWMAVAVIAVVCVLLGAAITLITGVVLFTSLAG